MSFLLWLWLTIKVWIDFCVGKNVLSCNKLMSSNEVSLKPAVCWSRKAFFAQWQYITISFNCISTFAYICMHFILIGMQWQSSNHIWYLKKSFFLYFLKAITVKTNVFVIKTGKKNLDSLHSSIELHLAHRTSQPQQWLLSQNTAKVFGTFMPLL